MSKVNNFAVFTASKDVSFNYFFISRTTMYMKK